MSANQRDLEELVAKGRLQTDAEQHAVAAREARYAAERAKTHARSVQLKTYGTWRSLSICTDLSVWLVLLVIALLGVRMGLEFDVLPWLVVACFSLVLCIGRVVARRRSTFALIADLPFETRGYLEFLHHPSSHCESGYMSAERVAVAVWFAAKSPPPEGVIAGALLGAGGRVFKGMGPKGITLEGGCAYDGQCRWLVNYMPTLCATLCTIHKVYPISSIEFGEA